MQACPYDAIHIDPDSGTAAKCNYCAHRVEVGLEPPCVNVCPTHAIVSGNMDDSSSEISNLLALHPVQVRKPEKGTRPNLFYIDGDEASLKPNATTANDGYMWTDVPPQGVDFNSWQGAIKRHDHEQTHLANGAEPKAAKTVYASTEPHRGSWGRSVSGYLFTKSVAAGIGLILAPLLFLVPEISSTHLAPAFLTALVFLALTNFMLVFKLERRERFIWVLTKPQWRSWLVRGAYLMIFYGGTLTLALVLTGLGEVLSPLFLLLIILGAFGTSIYTAFLFNQAKGRDLWQTPLLAIHLLIHSVVSGAAMLGLLALYLSDGIMVESLIIRILAAGLGINLLAMGAEFFSEHPTEDGEAAARLITRGTYRKSFWWGVFVGGHLVPIVLLALGWFIPGALLALLGVYLFEDIFIQAGQAIPLA